MSKIQVDILSNRAGTDNIHVSKIVHRNMEGTEIPTSGDFIVGDLMYNTLPTPGEYIGWVCVTSGNPGTWKPFGQITV